MNKMGIRRRKGKTALPLPRAGAYVRIVPAYTVLLAMLLVLLLAPAAGEEPAAALFEKHTAFSAQTGKEITWWLYTPEEIREDTSLVVFLHGSGEMGE